LNIRPCHICGVVGEQEKNIFFPARNLRLWQLSGSCGEFRLIDVCQLLSSTLDFDKLLATFFFCLFFLLRQSSSEHSVFQAPVCFSLSWHGGSCGLSVKRITSSGYTSGGAVTYVKILQGLRSTVE